ncbi:hypothetical protein JTE90_002598 [Oedothorax gibbosus]|uniref:Uncharacterized protein n=1 Tax=Oedothorax gibbosus TaxID=931172 RepID=A0AAV6V3V0_9ARAC|nr:hypothetical protein JTE90_002598 [Oedothorax gibbosus]
MGVEKKGDASENETSEWSCAEKTKRRNGVALKRRIGRLVFLWNEWREIFHLSKGGVTRGRYTSGTLRIETGINGVYVENGG